MFTTQRIVSKIMSSKSFISKRNYRDDGYGDERFKRFIDESVNLLNLFVFGMLPCILFKHVLDTVDKNYVYKQTEKIKDVKE